MSLTKFAMVEELACLVKDNIPCKYLILSVEEALVDFLQDDKSTGGVLELEPMNSYERLLIHRLADIFGFSHHSVGEGEERHIILECCPDTSLPPILVTDLLWQIGEVPPPMISDLPGQKKVMTANEPSLEERERNYLAARNRIFSADMQTELVKPRPRNDTGVARRMIAHALGKNSKEMTQERRLCNARERVETEDWKTQQVDQGDVGTSTSNKQDSNSVDQGDVGTSTSNKPDSNSVSAGHSESCAESNIHKFIGSESSSMSKLAQPQVKLALHKEGSVAERKENSTHRNHLEEEHTGAASSAAEQEENSTHRNHLEEEHTGAASSAAEQEENSLINKNHLRKQHMGAAKRLFANALGIQQRDTRQPKPT